MKFFWKIFFTAMFAGVAGASLSGFLLIRANFQASLQREVLAAYEYGDIVYFSLANELEESGQSDSPAPERIARVAGAIHIRAMTQRVAFAVVDDGGTVIFSSLEANLLKDNLSALGGHSRMWSLRQTAEGLYVQTLRPAAFGGTTVYIETLRDLSCALENQRLQYETLLRIMAGLLICGGLLTFVISRLLMRRVAALTRVTQRISAGDLSRRAAPGGFDEFAALSQSFNAMADELEGKIRELEEESERKELFVGAFSHELKTPLTSIIGYADLLRRKKPGAEQAQICAEYIFSEGKRLETLSMRLLELIVLRNRAMPLVLTDIRQIFQEVCALVAPQLTQVGIALCCDVEYGEIPLEPALMQSVFVNLIDNARKAMDVGGQIAVRDGFMGDAYIVTIQDDGRGMSREELSRIREAFYMADKSRSRRQGGAGLGLAICDTILSRHGFTISFESTVGSGTTVTVTMQGAGG